MSYNTDLEYRIDLLIEGLGPISKRKMFGGVGYLLGGAMCFGIHKEYLIVRTTQNRAAELVKSDCARPFDITGRPMKGWVMISPDNVETDERLLEMLKSGIDFVRDLPAK